MRKSGFTYHQSGLSTALWRSRVQTLDAACTPSPASEVVGKSLDVQRPDEGPHFTGSAPSQFGLNVIGKQWRILMERNVAYGG